jgi:uncharacterized membrane protein YobD (UPF0266 family)
LEQLRNDCETVLGNFLKAPEILLTQNGFFFGNMEYNRDYFVDVVKTFDIVTKVLETTDFEKEVIVYHSNW